MAQIDHPGFVRYRPIEIVGAMRVSTITRSPNGAPGYLIKDREDGETLISDKFFDRHNVHSGGYLLLLSNEKLSFVSGETLTDLVRI